MRSESERVESGLGGKREGMRKERGWTVEGGERQWGEKGKGERQSE